MCVVEEDRPVLHCSSAHSDVPSGACTTSTTNAGPITLTNGNGIANGSGASHGAGHVVCGRGGSAIVPAKTWTAAVARFCAKTGDTLEYGTLAKPRRIVAFIVSPGFG